MTADNDPFLDDVIGQALEAFDESLDNGSTDSPDNSATTQIPPQVRERIERGKHCLALLHFVSNSKKRDNHQSQPDRSPREPTRLGRFKIEAVLGTGGFGIVYRAFDPLAKRQVALKAPRVEALVSPELRRRFDQEAAAAARLEHPNIVAVLEAGLDAPVPFIASVYYAAPTLARWLRDHPGTLSPRQAAELVRQLALGVEHAHVRGVLHRDIKPSNVLLTTSSTGELVPKLTDFGLAKLMESGDWTQSGALLGTIKYMAPEQAAGQTRDIGPAADIYGLGALLYELLAGQPPFHAATDLEVIRQVQEKEPSSLTAANRAIPRDLETICLKCLEKSPAKRYTSATALAEDLRRFLAGEPIAARPVGAFERLIKWARRRPLAAAFAALASVAVASILAISLWANSQQAIANREILKQRQIAQEQTHLTKANLYVADLFLAEQALDRGAVDEARGLLDAYRETDPSLDLRTFEWRHLWHRLEEQSRPASTEESLSWKSQATKLEAVAISPDGQVVVAEGKKGSIDVFDASNGKPLRTIEAHSAEIVDLAFSPDGTELYSASDDFSVAMSDWKSGEVIHRFSEHTDEVYAVAVSPDGLRIATGGLDRQLIVWDRTNRKPLWKNRAHGDAIKCLRFSSKGDRLVSGSSDRTARVWNASSGEELARFEDRAKLFRGVAFLTDDIVATAGYDHVFRIWSIAKKDQLNAYSCEDQLTHVASHKNFPLAVVGSASGSLRAFSLEGTPQCLRLAFKGRIADLDFTEDGRALVIGYANGFIEVVPSAMLSARPPREIPVHASGPLVGFINNDLIVTGRYMAGPATNIVELSSGKTVEGARSLGALDALAVHPNQPTVAMASIEVPHLTDVGFLWRNVGKPGLPEKEPVLAFSDLAPGAERTVAFSWSPNGEFLAAGATTGELIVWDPLLKKAKWKKRAQETTISTVEWSRDGELIATAGAKEQAIRIWRANSGEEVQAFKMPREVKRCCFSPLDDVLAIGGSNGVALWDVKARRVRTSARLTDDAVSALAYSPDGAYLAVAHRDGTLVILESQSLQVAWRSIVGVVSLAFSPNGRWLVVGGRPRFTAVFDMRHIRCEDPYSSSLRYHPYGASIDPSGKRLVTGAFHTRNGGGLAVIDLESQSLEKCLPWSPVAARHTADGKRLLVCSQGSPGFRAHDPNSLEMIDVIVGDELDATSFQLALSPDGRWAAIEQQDKEMLVVDISAKRIHSRLGGNPSWPVFSRDNRFLIAVTGHSSLACWELPDCRQHWSATVPSEFRLGAIAVSPDGESVAVCNDRGSHAMIDWIRIADGTRIHRFVDSEISYYSHLAFSWDGRSLAAVDYYGKAVRFWNIVTKRPSLLLGLDQDTVDSFVAFSPDDRGVVVTGSRIYRDRAAVTVFHATSPPNRLEPEAIPAHSPGPAPAKLSLR